MGTGLDTERAVGIGGLYLESCRLQAGFFRIRRIHDLRRIAVTLRPAQVHTQKDLGEVGGIHAARTASNSNDRVALVVFTIKEGTNLKSRHVVLESAQVCFGLGKDIFRLRGIAFRSFARHIDDSLEVIDAFFHGQHAIELALAVRQLRGYFLSMRGVIPQVRSSRLLRQLFDLRTKTLGLHNCGDVLHGCAQGLDLFRKLNGHVTRVADSFAY